MGGEPGLVLEYFYERRLAAKLARKSLPDRL